MWSVGVFLKKNEERSSENEYLIDPYCLSLRMAAGNQWRDELQCVKGLMLEGIHEWGAQGLTSIERIFFFIMNELCFFFIFHMETRLTCSFEMVMNALWCSARVFRTRAAGAENTNHFSSLQPKLFLDMLSCVFFLFPLCSSVSACVWWWCVWGGGAFY